MCGIAGVVSLNAEPANPAFVEGMLQRLVHRGPDDEGCATLGLATMGMRRLSILDPSARGHQPMTSTDRRYTIVHNGEVYNFLELADELGELGHTFETTTDTEVILSAYAEWGPECLRKFNGIWAFAIWDALEKSLFLARDRMGVKPLFLSEGGGQLAFASEIKALRSLPWVSADPQPEVIHDYLLDGTVDHRPQTFYRDIEHFPAACSLVLSPQGRRWRSYWEPPKLTTDASMRAHPGDPQLVEQFGSLLIDAVGLQLRSDVAIGSCLSGGIDSSSIVSIAAGLRSRRLHSEGREHHERDAVPQMAFFAEFREAGIDERPYVDAVVQATGVTLHTTTPDPGLFVESLEGVMDAQDEPFGSLSIVAQYHVMRIAHEAGIKVLLDGQGADELLGGYLNYRGIRLAGALRTGDLPSRVDAIRSLTGAGAPVRSAIGHGALGTAHLPSRLVRGRMPRVWFGDALGAPHPASHPPSQAGTLLTSKLWRDVAQDNLPGLLRYEDRNSMAFGIEARVPFLDHRVVEAALALPDRLKVDGRSGRKIALHRAMEGIVPREVLDRRDKVAFQPPQNRWLRNSIGRWHALAAASRAEGSGLLAPGAIRNALAAFDVGRIEGNALWRVLNLELWLRGSAG